MSSQNLGAVQSWPARVKVPRVSTLRVMASKQSISSSASSDCLLKQAKGTSVFQKWHMQQEKEHQVLFGNRSTAVMNLYGTLGELTARERTAHNATPPLTRQPDKVKPMATALFANASRSAMPLCCYCQQNHSSRDCTMVTSATARKQILRTSGRCFNCLARGHRGRNCRSTGRCFKCKGKHHTSVCEGHDQTLPGMNKSHAQGSALNPDAPSFTSTSSNFCASSVKSVLLQTARTCIYNASAPHRSACCSIVGARGHTCLSV